MSYNDWNKSHNIVSLTKARILTFFCVHGFYLNQTNINYRNLRASIKKNIS